jgi:AraC-like DNA-binding protein
MSDTMIFRSYTPCAPLSQFVVDFWLYEGYDGKHQRELILPSGTFEMVFNLEEDELRIYDPAEPRLCKRFRGAIVSGPYSRSFMSDGAEEKSLLGVHFKPGGAAGFLGLPASDFRDEHVDLRTLWGPLADTVRARLCALQEPASKFRLLEEMLMRRLAAYAGGGHAAVRIALDVIQSSRGGERTRDIAGAVELSQRRLIEVFATEVGLTPKVFSRITRFQHAIARSQAGTEADWAQLALECGYYDQSHMIHDFVTFAGVAPEDYRRRHGGLELAGAHTKRHHLPLVGQFNFFQ